MRILATAIFATLVFATASALAADPPPEKTGVKLGDKAPDFTLKDQNGKDRSLAEFLNKGKVAIVFYRSASW